MMGSEEIGGADGRLGVRHDRRDRGRERVADIRCVLWRQPRRQIAEMNGEAVVIVGDIDGDIIPGGILALDIAESHVADLDVVHVKALDTDNGVE